MKLINNPLISLTNYDFLEAAVMDYHYFTAKSRQLVTTFKRRPVHFILTFIIILYLVNGIFYLRVQSQTSDEGSFLSYSAQFVKGHTEKIYRGNDSKIPVTVINLIPRAMSQLFHHGPKKRPTTAKVTCWRDDK